MKITGKWVVFAILSLLWVGTVHAEENPLLLDTFSVKEDLQRVHILEHRYDKDTDLSQSCYHPHSSLAAYCYTRIFRADKWWEPVKKSEFNEEQLSEVINRDLLMQKSAGYELISFRHFALAEKSKIVRRQNRLFVKIPASFRIRPVRNEKLVDEAGTISILGFVYIPYEGQSVQDLYPIKSFDKLLVANDKDLELISNAYAHTQGSQSMVIMTALFDPSTIHGLTKEMDLPRKLIEEFAPFTKAFLEYIQSTPEFKVGVLRAVDNLITDESIEVESRP